MFLKLVSSTTSHGCSGPLLPLQPPPATMHLTWDSSSVPKTTKSHLCKFTKPWPLILILLLISHLLTKALTRAPPLPVMSMGGWGRESGSGGQKQTKQTFFKKIFCNIFTMLLEWLRLYFITFEARWRGIQWAERQKNLLAKAGSQW